jgi:hypothetical protein
MCDKIWQTEIPTTFHPYVSKQGFAHVVPCRRNIRQVLRLFELPSMADGPVRYCRLVNHIADRSSTLATITCVPISFLLIPILSSQGSK